MHVLRVPCLQAGCEQHQPQEKPTLHSVDESVLQVSHPRYTPTSIGESALSNLLVQDSADVFEDSNPFATAGCYTADPPTDSVNSEEVNNPRHLVEVEGAEVCIDLQGT